MSSSSMVRGLIGRAAGVPAAAVALGVFGAVLAAPPAAAVTGVGSALYDTPGTYTWTVPPGVFSASFGLIGGAGGAGTAASLSSGGGPGGELTATLYVTPGDTYTVVVGGRGGPAGLVGP